MCACDFVSGNEELKMQFAHVLGIQNMPKANIQQLQLTDSS